MKSQQNPWSSYLSEDEDEGETDIDFSYLDNDEIMKRASHISDPFKKELEIMEAKGYLFDNVETGLNLESTQTTEKEAVVADAEFNWYVDNYWNDHEGVVANGEVVREDVAPVDNDTLMGLPEQEFVEYVAQRFDEEHEIDNLIDGFLEELKLEEAVSEDFASNRVESPNPLEVMNDLTEAVKFQGELEQAIKMTTQGTPRQRSLVWRHEKITAAIAMLLALPGAMGQQMLSPQEQWANAISTLIWTIMGAFVLYLFGKAIAKAITRCTTAILQVATALSNALTLLSTAFATTLGVVNTKLGVLVDAHIEYLKWMKIISLITAVATGVNSLIGLIRLPFSLFSKAAACSSSFCKMSSEGRESHRFKAQDANRYGFFVSTILATCMFIFVPLWGFSKSYKCFEAPMRILERLPYATWLFDFIRDWSEGKATTADIPEDVQEFARGKEARRRPDGLFDFGYGTSHLQKEHDLETCENDKRLTGKCGDGQCYCKCHIAEEEGEAQSTIKEVAEGEGGVLENTAGLGSRARQYITKNQIPFVRSQAEPIESRKERLTAEDQVCERCNGDSKGKKLCFECFTAGTTLTKEEKGKEKERLCKECENTLRPECIAICDPCIAKKVQARVAEEQKVGMNPESLSLGLNGWFVRERVLWAVCQELGLEVVDYLRIRMNQFVDHVKDHKLYYAASAMTAIAVIVTAVSLFVSDDDEPRKLTASPVERLEGRTEKRSRVIMAPRQYATRKNRSRSGQAQQGSKPRHHVPSGGAENDFEEPDTVSEERYQREQEERERAIALEIAFQDRERDRKQWEETEQEECIHYANCPTMPMNIDAKNACNKACGGHHCAHFANCVPQNEKSEGLSRKTRELRMKHFPIERKPVEVARVARVVRKAQREGHHYTIEEKKQFDDVKRKTPVLMSSESLLGKTRQIHRDVASHVFKVFYDGEMTSSATIVADKVVVPLHSHIDGKKVSIGNASASAQLRGEIIPIADDLGVFYHYGAVSCKGWRMEIPTTGICTQLGFKSQDETEPSHGVGFYSSSGLYDAPTEAGNCAGPVVSCATGALIGFHIAGSDNVNRFVPLTEQLIQRLKMSEPVLTSSLFQ